MKLALALLVFSAAASAPQDPTDVGAALSQAGIRPLDPPVAAEDFSLAGVGGKTVALSQSRGRWVVLTFFATWCGPCAAELPTLQKLHEARRGNGLDVLGVALDPDPGQVAAFVRAKGVAFPVGVDTGGKVGATYQASSIPMSYLIDPKGLIRGVAMGARDWTQLTPLVDALLGLPSGAGSGAPAYAGPSAPVKLPDNVAPPQATVWTEKTTATPGDPFLVEVQVRWKGDASDYVLHPPTLHLPQGIRLDSTSAASTSGSGRQVITYKLALVATEPGRYALDPVELSYTPRGQSERLTRRVAGPTVTVEPNGASLLRPRVLIVSGGMALGFGGLVVGILRLRKRRAGRRAVPSEPEGYYEQLRLRYDDARAKRLRGDVAGFLGTLADVEASLDKTSGSHEEIAALVEQARYGGLPPSEAVLDRLQRRVELKIGEREPRD